jgi:hypothetical protein
MTEDTDNLLLDRILQQRDRLEDSSTDIRDIDVLDIEYTVTQDMHVKEVSLQLCFGGPTIYLDCISGRLRGYWGSEQITRGVHSDAVGQYGSELARRFEERIQS